MFRAFIDEIYSSIQGEGIFIGQRHLFVRFHGCTLRCQYCDTQESLGPPGFCSIERTPGKGDMYLVRNPFTPTRLTRTLLHFIRSANNLHKTVALTGGEPLEHSDFLLEWLPTAKKYFRIFLETNGIYPAYLKRLIRYVDATAMDIKLPSSTAMGGFWEEHRKFLRIASQKEVFVKMIITRETDSFEILKAGTLVSKVNKKIPVILQPVTPMGSIRHSPPPIQLLELQRSLSDLVDDVRVIPQVHKLYPIL